MNLEQPDPQLLALLPTPIQFKGREMDRRQTRRSFIKSLAGAASALLFLKSGLWNNVVASPIPSQQGKIDELIDYDALGLAQLIKKGDISQAELVEVIIRRIEALDPVLNFMTTPTFDRARKRAGTIPLDSTFAGVPILIKDMVDVGGVRRTDGSRMRLTYVPENSVEYIKGVETAGLNIIGMTNVPEFANLAVTNNSHFGLTRNPWDLSKSPFGSSGGAGTAVAAGILPLVHGTDGGGSNRLPSNVCGLLGMKPSRERMLSGEADGGHELFKTNQSISRTVRDSAALFDKTEDKSGKVFAPVGLVEGPGKRRLKVAYATMAKGIQSYHPEVRTAQENVVGVLEGLGHQVSETIFPVNIEEFFQYYYDAFLPRFGFVVRAAEQLSGRSAEESGLLDPFTISMSRYGDQVSKRSSSQRIALS